MTGTLKQVFATRNLHLLKDGRKKSVTVKLGKPYRLGPAKWVCPYRVTGTGARGLREVPGIDSFQALTHALGSIRVDLEKAGGTILWEGGKANDAGFPLYVPTFFGREFSHRVERIIDREMARRARMARKRKAAARGRKTR